LIDNPNFVGVRSDRSRQSGSAAGRFQRVVSVTA
jgi:hypothetical protein